MSSRYMPSAPRCWLLFSREHGMKLHQQQEQQMTLMDEGRLSTRIPLNCLQTRHTVPFFLDGESVLLIGLPLFLPSSTWSGRILGHTEQAVKPSISVHSGPTLSTSFPIRIKKKGNSWGIRTNSWINGMYWWKRSTLGYSSKMLPLL